jgi:hypothetical protein
MRSESKKGKRRRGGGKRLENKTDESKKYGYIEGYSKISSELKSVTLRLI